MINTKQNGAALPTIFLGIVVASFFVLLGFRLVPIYLENHSVASTLNALPNLPVMKKARETGTVRNSIRRYINRNFSVNDVSRITAKDVKITSKKNGFHVSAKYDVTVHLFANIDAVIHFDEQVMVPRS